MIYEPFGLRAISLEPGGFHVEALSANVFWSFFLFRRHLLTFFALSACYSQLQQLAASPLSSLAMGKKQQHRNNAKVSTAPLNATKSLVDSLPLEEKHHLERCTLDYATTNLGHDEFVQKAVETLEQEHVLVVHNCFSEKEVKTLHDCYVSHHGRQAGQQAIGEKDASKRSGTRLYNCLCQLGPACGFYDWKEGTTEAQHILNPSLITDYRKPPRKAVWKSIADAFHFHHVARVEVVTSHVGCRAQGWHIDGVHGLTVIMPLTDVGVRQGPTELDLSVPFVGLWEGDPKVRRSCSNDTRVRAVMPQGSVLLFNANVSHRGSANIGTKDRPILVVDCSLDCTCLAAGGPRDVWSV